MTCVAKMPFVVARCAAFVLVAVSLFGCAAVQMAPPTGSAKIAEKLRAAHLAPATTGTFKIAPDKNPEMDKTVGGLRGSSVAPASGSYSQHLKEQIIADLKSAGLYDPKSGIVIEAQLTDSMVDAAIGTGVGRLAARFTVIRAGQRKYDKELAVDDKWESSFVGAIAIPAAINHYTALYKSLATKLYDDPDFRAALKR